jgi:hypothetical protein
LSTLLKPFDIRFCYKFIKKPSRFQKLGKLNFFFYQGEVLNT